MSEPKFRVGDRVIRWGKDLGTVSSVGVFVRFDDPGIDDCYVISHPSVIALAPPEPPAPKWRAERTPWSPSEWRVMRGGGEWAGTLHSEHLAQEVADLLNAEQAQ